MFLTCFFYFKRSYHGFIIISCRNGPIRRIINGERASCISATKQLNIEPFSKIVITKAYFRKFNGALSAFASKLLMNGYTVEKIIELIEDESWIIDIFDEIYKKEISGQIECNISKYTIYSNAIKDLRQKRKVEAFI